VRHRAAAAIVLMALAVPIGVASAGDTVRERYQRYAEIREQMLACSLDATWNHMSATWKRRCVRLRRLYTLWIDPTYGASNYHLHCRTRSRCPAPPIGEPDPRDPIPRRALVVR
jgi:hypothetical protein